MKQKFSGTIPAKRTAIKFVAPLTDEERLRLKETHKTDPNWRTRVRAQAILLSEKGFALNQLATIFEIDRDSVSQWLERNSHQL